MTRPRRAVIAGGGTGGHFYPALALAQTLAERGWQSLFLLRSGDPAGPRLDAAGLPWTELDLRGLPRRPSLEALAFPWRAARALARASRIMRDFRPDVVVGMGGYLSFPAVAAAALSGIPRTVHESNAPLGLANRLCVRLGAALLRGLPGPGGELIGTPIRRSLWDAAGLDPRAARRELGLDESLPTLLVFGGSQGARALNEGVPAALSEASGIQVLHLAGQGKEEGVRRAYGAVPAAVLPYLERMELAYAAADLVVCRSGASTLAELIAARRPAILVPYPSAAGNHQEANARLLEASGAARVALESEPGALSAHLRDLLLSGPSASERRRALSSAFAGLRVPPPSEAASRMADAAERLSKRH